MQPSKEREASDGDPMDDLDDLLDDDLAGEESTAASDGSRSEAATDDAAARGNGAGDAGDDGGRGRDWFSAKAFALSLAAVAAGVFAGGAIPLIGGTVGSAGGVFLAAFLIGLALSARRYVEIGLAGAAAGAIVAVTNLLNVGFLPIGLDYLGQWGIPLLAVGGGLGLVVALVGHYFGRDLRAGLTADVDG